MKIGRKRIYPSHVLIYILLSLWALTTVFPFLWVLISSYRCDFQGTRSVFQTFQEG